MAMAFTQEQTRETDEALWPEDAAAIAWSDPAARLAPVLEGARARGVLDAFDMTGQAAILLGRAGEVLQVGASARALLGAGLRLEGGRLVARDEDNQGLERQLAHVLEGGQASQAQGIILAAAGGGIMRVRMHAFAGGNANPAQILKAVVLLDPLA